MISFADIYIASVAPSEETLMGSAPLRYLGTPMTKLQSIALVTSKMVLKFNWFSGEVVKWELLEQTL